MSKQNKKGLKLLVKQIENSNEKFAKATPAQKIVMVAKDVIKLLDTGRAKATHGIYFELPRYEMADFTITKEIPKEIGIGRQLSEVLKMPDLPACNVCAIGAGMLAATMRLNKVRVKDNLSYGLTETYNTSPGKDTMSSRVQGVFGNDLLREMEDAFEEGQHGYHRIKGAEARIRNIYQNLIDNKGKCFTHFRSKKVVYPYPEEK